MAQCSSQAYATLDKTAIFIAITPFHLQPYPCGSVILRIYRFLFASYWQQGLKHDRDQFPFDNQSFLVDRRPHQKRQSLHPDTFHHACISRKIQEEMKEIDKVLVQQWSILTIIHSCGGYRFVPMKSMNQTLQIQQLRSLLALFRQILARRGPFEV